MAAELVDPGRLAFESALIVAATATPLRGRAQPVETFVPLGAGGS